MITPKEREIVLLVYGDCMSHQQAASHLMISKRTVDFHVNSIHKKFGVKNKAGATHEAIRRGYVAA